MRLLRILDDGGVSFTKDLSDVEAFKLKYAILSHTWGSEEEEVTYNDIQQEVGLQEIDQGTTSKIGWRKIRFCMTQATLHGLTHFWIDTCCIDKRNETELSKSLRSMFRWYAHADRCYVYLSDNTSLGDSKWFTRGWTLQELIAPTILEFFRHEAPIGTKASLENEISDITGIPIRVLRGRDLSEYSPLERMQWQKGRQTKEPEDLAYSLLGIVDVSIPVLYGEGFEKAQERLLRELRLTQPTLTLPPSRSFRSMAAAERVYDLTLQRKERNPGHHESTLQTLHDLGLIYFRQGKVADAQHMLERCLAGREELLGPEHLSTLDTVSRLGELYHLQAQSIRARTLLLRALQGREQTLGANDPTTLDTVSALGRLYLWLGKYIQAKQMFMQALEGRASRGPDHVSMFGALHDLGLLLRMQGKFPDAAQKFKQALEGRERLLGREHTDTLESVHQLGFVLDYQGWVTKDEVAKAMTHKDKPRFSEEEQLLTRALTGFDRALGPHHESTLQTVESLAHTYVKNGNDLARAEELYARVQHSREYTRRFLPEHPRALLTLQRIAVLRKKQERLEEAEQLLKRCLEGYTRLDEACPSMTLRALHELAIVYKRQDKLQDAEAVFLQLLDEGEQIGLGPENLNMALTRCELMLIYTSQHRYEEAQALFNTAKGHYDQMDPMSQHLMDTIDVVRRNVPWQPGSLTKGMQKVWQLFQRRQPSQQDEVKLLKCSE